MTERIYYDDSYVTSFDARVVDRGDGGTRVYLDRSAFYPTSGGQPHDTGTLGGVAVVDVVDEDERIAHVLASPLDVERVEGRIDWPRRFDHMQQHTGQHLLSAVLADLFGYATVSVHFGGDGSTLDLDAPNIPRERVLAAEARANAVVFENRPVRVSFEDAATAAGLRKASDREGTLRIVTIDGLDRSACGGTHVRATGEIGPILIRRIDRVRQSARLEFVCGSRAVRRARADYDALAQLAQALSAAPDEVPALITTQASRLRDAESRLRSLGEEIATYRARELYEAAPAGPDGVRRIVERLDTGSLAELRPLAQGVSALPKAVFIGVVTSPAPGVIVAAADDAKVDAGRILKEALAAVGGRGGGSARLAQGTLPDADALERVIAVVMAG